MRSQEKRTKWITSIFQTKCRIKPVIPPANPEAGREPDTDGWAAIGRVGAWEAMLQEFNMLEEIPEQHKSVFGTKCGSSRRVVW